MANDSLAAGPLSRNDISRLTRFFESIFHYCARHAVHRSLDHPIVNVAEKRAEALSLFQLLLQKQ